MQDGEQAVSYLQQSCLGSGVSPDQRPQLVFLDLNMPRRDGLQTLEWIRREEALKGMKVVLVTDSQRPEHLARAKELQADGYLLKHPGPTIVGFVIRQALSLGEP